MNAKKKSGNLNSGGWSLEIQPAEADEFYSDKVTNFRISFRRKVLYRNGFRKFLFRHDLFFSPKFRRKLPRAFEIAGSHTPYRIQPISGVFACARFCVFGSCRRCAGSYTV